MPQSNREAVLEYLAGLRSEAEGELMEDGSSAYWEGYIDAIENLIQYVENA